MQEFYYLFIRFIICASPALIILSLTLYEREHNLPKAIMASVSALALLTFCSSFYIFLSNMLSPIDFSGDDSGIGLIFLIGVPLIFFFGFYIIFRYWINLKIAIILLIDFCLILSSYLLIFQIARKSSTYMGMHVNFFAFSPTPTPTVPLGWAGLKMTPDILMPEKNCTVDNLRNIYVCNFTLEIEGYGRKKPFEITWDNEVFDKNYKKTNVVSITSASNTTRDGFLPQEIVMQAPINVCIGIVDDKPVYTIKFFVRGSKDLFSYVYFKCK